MSDHGGRSSGDIDTAKRRSLKNTDRSDFKPVSANSQVVIKDDLSGVGLSSVHDRSRKSHESHGESAVKLSEVNRLVLSVGIEEADIVRVND